ncbi:hypothetical protein Acj9p059 [Acinetobacter phage Acj9]|uniref:Conserved hypothetical phage protein n=1 Tax=Acinetobacter phage Acj9 TaxID=760939 RepID=E5EPJ3_9CAUD|nr:hypothetical protein Acj9p059 [Acinetobacter phage Acj9]ADG59959.1 conserved hypothetical phage protein [Acinetobacter phage Acj9]
MNIFERNEKLKKEINDRAQVFVRLAAAAIAQLSKDPYKSTLVPSFITGYHGFHTEVFPFDNSLWVPNPNYKPGLSKAEYEKPENREVDAGFPQINVIEKMVRICAVEVQDNWDDCAGEPEVWNLELIPQELFLSGTEAKITTFFEERFKAQAERENDNAFRGKWSALFYYYTAEELEQYAKAMKDAKSEYPGERFEETLVAMGAKDEHN